MGEGDLAEHVDDLICVMDKVVGSQVEITDHYRVELQTIHRLVGAFSVIVKTDGSFAALL